MVDLDLRKRVSFQEAEGTIPLPSQLQWGQVDARLRSRLWRTFYRTISRHIKSYSYDSHSYLSPVREILNDEHVENSFLAANKFRSSSSRKEKLIERYEALFMKSNYADVFGFVQYFLRHERCPEQLISEISQLFKEVGGAHQILTSPPTIIPIATQEEMDAISINLAVVTGSEFRGAQEHLRLASAALSEGRYGDCIRDSVHAIESSVKKITGKKAATLNAALPELERHVVMHTSFKEAVKRLYGWTSDEKGVRHALLESSNPAVGLEEALFMFGACASFTSYLISKAARSSSPDGAPA